MQLSDKENGEIIDPLVFPNEFFPNVNNTCVNLTLYLCVNMITLLPTQILVIYVSFFEALRLEKPPTVARNLSPSAPSPT